MFIKRGSSVFFLVDFNVFGLVCVMPRERLSGGFLCRFLGLSSGCSSEFGQTKGEAQAETSVLVEKNVVF